MNNKKIHNPSPLSLSLLFLYLGLCSGSLPTAYAESASTTEVRSTLDQITDSLLFATDRVSIGFQGGDSTAIGDLKIIEVTSKISGRLIVLDVDPNGDIVQLYPNKYTDLSHWQINANQTFVLPDGASYQFRTWKPSGRSQLLAIVVPANFDDKSLVTDTSRVTNKLAVEADPQGYLQKLKALIRQAMGSQTKSLRIETVPTSSTAGWALTTKEYFVNDKRLTENEYLSDDEHVTSQTLLTEPEKMPDQEVTLVREISEAGLELTKVSEGFRHNMYHDVVRFCTIGYGHLIRKSPCDGTPEEFAKGITEPRGSEILKKDMHQAKAAVSKHTKVPLTDGQYAALADFTFNVGSEKYRTSTLLKKINRNQINEVPNELRRWVKAAGGKIFSGLQKRREREIALFFEGVPIPETKSILPSEMIDIEVGEPLAQ